MSLNFQTFCYNFKIKILGAKIHDCYLYLNFEKKKKKFRVKESMIFVEQKRKL